MESPLCPPDDPGFRLIETLRWEPARGVVRQDRHLARLTRSAARLGIAPHGVNAALDGIVGDGPRRVRLTVDRDGRAEVTHAPYVPMAEAAVWRVAVADERLRSDDPWLGLKTTRRQVYDAARANLPEGVEELLFLNERSELCEGTITNLFAELDDGLVTPPLFCGVLPGILREELIATGDAREAVLRPEDLGNARALYVGNALRGLIRARLV